MSKRKPKFSVVTNDMSEETYNKMLKLADKRLFTQTVIELFENKEQQDIVISELKKELQDVRKLLSKEFSNLNKQLSNIQVVSTSSSYDNEEIISVAPEFVEGDEIRGQIEEETEIDF